MEDTTFLNWFADLEFSEIENFDPRLWLSSQKKPKKKLRKFENKFFVKRNKMSDI